MRVVLKIVGLLILILVVIFLVYAFTGGGSEEVTIERDAPPKATFEPSG